jgi:hypothetical protein
VVRVQALVHAIFVVVNLAIALALMEGDMFSALSWILGFYSNFAIRKPRPPG